jgi:hypothetical protein
VLAELKHLNFMTDTNGKNILSTRQAALIAGWGYVIVFLLGIFANFFIFEKLINLKDASETFQQISNHQILFRVGIASWIVVIVCDTAVAWAMYLLFKPVHEAFALAAAWLRLVFVALFAGAFVHYFSVLHLLSADHVSTNASSVQEQVLVFLQAQESSVHIAFVFFGLHVLAIGYLILKTVKAPRLLGFLLLAAGIGYLIDSFGNFISPAYANNEHAFLYTVALPALTSELTLMFWLLFKAGKNKTA